MEIIATFEPDLKTERNLNRLPDEILYTIAKEVLDMTDSLEYFPKDSGDLERSSMAAGVRGESGEYYIGSFVDYASHVWNMSQTDTQWTNPKSKSKWYAYTLKTHGQLILDTAVNREWKENM